MSENKNLQYVQTQVAKATKFDRQSEVALIGALQRAVRCAYAGSLTESNFILGTVPDRMRKTCTWFLTKFGVDVAHVKDAIPRARGIVDKSEQAKQLEKLRAVDSLGWMKVSTEEELIEKKGKAKARKDKYVAEHTVSERLQKIFERAIKSCSDDPDVNIALNRVLAAVKDGKVKLA